MEAILIRHVAKVATGVLFPHALTQPVQCPGGCGEDYVVLLDQPLALRSRWDLEEKTTSPC
jgi:hypothetical protein